MSKLNVPDIVKDDSIFWLKVQLSRRKNNSDIGQGKHTLLIFHVSKHVQISLVKFYIQISIQFETKHLKPTWACP